MSVTDSKFQNILVCLLIKYKCLKQFFTVQHIQYREDTLFNVHWWFKHNHALSFTINIVIDSAGTKRICFLLPRSTGKTLNKLHTTKVNIVIMLIDMFMAYGIR